MNFGDRAADFIINTFPRLTAWIGGMNAQESLLLAASVMVVCLIGYYCFFRYANNYPDNEDFNPEWMDYKKWRETDGV